MAAPNFPLNNVPANWPKPNPVALSNTATAMPSIAFPMPELPPLAAFQLPVDNFNPVATALIQPNQTTSYQVIAEIRANGQIMQAGLNGYQPLGQIDGQGNFQLTNGQRGNVFRDTQTVKVLGLEDKENPFARALNNAERQRAISGSEIPLIRQQLTNRGINGQGVTIGILDPFKKKPNTNEWEASPHTKIVTQTIQDPVWGVSPGSQVEDLGWQQDMDYKIPADNVQAFVNAFTEDATNFYAKTAHQLQAAIAKKNPALRVINITWGNSRTETYGETWNKLIQRDDNGYYKYPAIRAAIMGPTLYGTTQQQFQAVANAVDRILDSTPQIQQAYQQYVEQTRQAAQNSMIVVVAAANNNRRLPFDIPVQPGADLNDFAKSPYVISVAAADTNQTPGNRANYTIAPFSSHGDGVRWNPTITAPGAEIGISFPQAGMGHNNVVRGTSFSTPFTCGVIAMMLQRNPWMTFEQVKACLQGTATPIPNATIAEQGAGVINPERAV